MAEIQLLYIENIIKSKNRKPRQQLTFFMGVNNINHEKQVDVLWEGEEGVWHTLQAFFHSTLHEEKECWQARATFSISDNQTLPGTIRFGLRYRTTGQEFWDNNLGQNYTSLADSGIQLGQNIQIQNMGFQNHLKENQKSVPVTVLLDEAIQAETVTVFWTLDNWQHTRKTLCKLKKNSRNSEQHGTQKWFARLRTGNAFRLQYSICCKSKGQVFWDNNEGKNYLATHKELNIMILNLHCYQEQQQDQKLSLIAKAINEQQVDIICFQEVAENWNEGQGDWPSNSVNIINQRLEKPFHLFTDWSHLGFDKYREGVAILSRFPLLKQEARYVSESHDIYSIHSRKVVMSQIRVPFIGLINVFSAHLSWWEDGFQQQFMNLCKWANSKTGKRVKATLLCGDFNIAAGSEGYQQVVNSHEYEDQFLAANHKDSFNKIFRVNDPHWGDYLADDYRIDYIFMGIESKLQVTTAKVVFTEQDYGQVSDHCGYIMKFELNFHS